MPRVLITGANRGLGLEFARQYAADGWSVIGTYRDPATAAELDALPGDVKSLQLDVVDDASIVNFVATIKDMPLDLFIANAGVSGGPDAVAEVRRENWEPIILANTLAPFRLATALRSNIEKGELKKVVGVSSLAASTGTYQVQGQYAYRASKAAMNALWRNLSIEWKPQGITCLVLRPGRVRTRMTDFAGDLGPDESVAGMKKVIDGAGPAESGRFFGYDGIEVPW